LVAALPVGERSDAPGQARTRRPLAIMETVNEEFQATNEELETLNEELTGERLRSCGSRTRTSPRAPKELSAHRLLEQGVGHSGGALSSPIGFWPASGDAFVAVDHEGPDHDDNDAYDRFFGGAEPISPIPRFFRSRRPTDRSDGPPEANVPNGVRGDPAWGDAALVPRPWRSRSPPATRTWGGVLTIRDPFRAHNAAQPGALDARGRTRAQDPGPCAWIPPARRAAPRPGELHASPHLCARATRADQADRGAHRASLRRESHPRPVDLELCHRPRSIC